ncbi:DUF3565 domain-containing protein [Pseudomonas sp. RP23018S]|nr:DUF3565 domain-containing protein [Pseudomonas sp. RP23018S]MDZ5604807.1 DUF3565 domain-containing protein [Pseudomonas sp. RP23018S]
MQKNVEPGSVTKASPDCEPAKASARPNGSQPRPVSHISGFHRDEAGHWVVELSCGHTQHLRHQPPWQSRPWVLDPTARQQRIGEAFPCGWCAQGVDSATLAD